MDYSVVVFFFGGLDDREVLVYGFCMVEYLGIKFYVICFLINNGMMGDDVSILVWVVLVGFEFFEIVNDSCY